MRLSIVPRASRSLAAATSAMGAAAAVAARRVALPSNGMAATAARLQLPYIYRTFGSEASQTYVIVVGGAGALGREVVKTLRQRGWRVVSVDLG